MNSVEKTVLNDDVYIKAYAVKHGVMIDAGNIIPLSEFLGGISESIADYVIKKIGGSDGKNN